MIIAYSDIVRKPQEHGQPELAVCGSVNFMVVLRSTDFDVRYKDGRAEVSLARHMDAAELKALGEAMIRAADDTQHSYCNVGTVVVQEFKS